MFVLSEPITVIKGNDAGEEVWHYSGIILLGESNIVVRDAR